MAIERTEKKDNFTILSNECLKDKTISLKAKGLWALMLTYPDDWSFSIEQLISTGVDGRSAIMASIKELIEHGYIVVEKKREHGKFASFYTVFEKPTRFIRRGLTDTENQTLLNTNKPITNNQIEKHTKESDLDEEFEIFWKEYPKKKNKPDAEKAWKKIKPPLDKVLSALDVQKRSSDWLDNDGKYIPYPASYIRGRRWEDEGIVEAQQDNENGKPSYDYGSGIYSF